MVGDDPGSHYATNAFLKINYNFDLSELDELISWERDLMISFVERDLDEKAKLIQQRQ